MLNQYTIINKWMPNYWNLLEHCTVHETSSTRSDIEYMEKYKGGCSNKCKDMHIVRVFYEIKVCFIQF